MSASAPQNPLRRRTFETDPEAPDTKIFIPYWPGDDGDRSIGFSAKVTWWWCDGIRIFLPDGTPYTGGTLPRDAASSVAVRVANSGSAPAWASVKAFWTDPSAGFGPPHLGTAPLFTTPFKSLRVPAATTVTTDPVPFTPAGDTPDHICIVAVVSAFGDEPDGTWAVGGDSHYAQHNVNVVHLDPGGVQAVAFFVKNPFPDASARVNVRITSAPLEQLEALSAIYHAEPSDIGQEYVGLSTQGLPMDTAAELELELGPGERSRCHALLAPGVLAPGQFGTVEVRTTASSPKQPDREGALGLIVFPPTG